MNQYPVVADFVRHLAYYRAAKPIYDRLGLTSPFWKATIDAHLMIASVHWCKVFGSYGPNPIHWTKTPTVHEQSQQDSFRGGVLSTVGLSQQEWTDYHKSMCEFRDKYVAHQETGFAAPVPNFDIALNVAFAYDKWIRDLIKPDFFDDLSLKEYFQNWVSQATRIAESAMTATHGMKG